MKIMMEKYHGLGNDYLIWDPIKNEMELDSNRVKNIFKSNLGTGSSKIIYGPIFEEDRVRLCVFCPNGQESDINSEDVCIFIKYLKDAGYAINGLIKLSTSSGVIDISWQSENIGKVKNTGFILLMNQFIEELVLV